MSCYITYTVRNCLETYKVWQSVARPEMPMRTLSLTLNTLWKVVSMVMSCVERRVSVAMAIPRGARSACETVRHKTVDMGLRSGKKTHDLLPQSNY